MKTFLKENKFGVVKTTFNNAIKTKKLLLIIPYALLCIIFLAIPLILVLFNSFIGDVSASWMVVNNFIWQKILLSIVLALIATIICIFISYPFSYFIAFSKYKIWKSVVIILITTPVWSSYLIKIIGLKTFFDLCLGFSNATYGHIFTVIGLVYIYTPFMILPIYNVLNDMPKNLIFASQDLGHNYFSTFVRVIFPFTRNAFFAGITLVFLPAVTTVAIPQFLNNNTDSSMIGDIITQEGEQGLISKIALTRASVVSLIVSIVSLLLYGFIAFIPKIGQLIRKHHPITKKEEKNG